jgi:hypothetical protein
LDVDAVGFLRQGVGGGRPEEYRVSINIRRWLM